MKNLSEFLAKLDKLTYNTVDRNKLTLTSEEGYTVKLVLEINTVVMKKVYPIQVVVRVMKEGVIVATWGCDDNESNQEAIYWLYGKGVKLRDIQYDEEDNKAKALKDEFNNL